MNSQQNRQETINKNRSHYSITKKKAGNFGAILPVYTFELTYKGYYLGDWSTKEEAESELERHINSATFNF